ncbi:MAG: c-type cytochrome [Bacteroidetes bacterium]|nr:c-type cytochrome [Bacteroidota bacterium]
MTTKPIDSKRLTLVGSLAIIVVGVAAFFFGKTEGSAKYKHMSAFAWDKDEWAKRTKGIRTSYNPDHDLNTETLTLVPGDPRWLDFVFWCFNNKVAEHQVEAYGGTDWDGPKGGVIFHWAPGSRWETHTLASFGFTIGHTIGEHQWKDTQFPEFFEKYGGTYGINVKDRLAEIDTASPNGWVDFLDYCGGPNSPYYRYLFHQESVVDPVHNKIYLIGGQGVEFEYSFERYYHELREVLTDARAYQFFQMYDLYGPGFASMTGWAKNKLNATEHGLSFTDDTSKWMTKPGVAWATKYNPNPQLPTVPAHMREHDAAVAGQTVYRQQCTPCHGVNGDGKGFLAAGFEVPPRDFRLGLYKFRSTVGGAFPTMGDLEHIIRVGVNGGTMPAWGEFLTPEQIHNVAVYLVTFSERFLDAWNARKEPEVLKIPPVPSNLASMVEQGKQVFAQMQCAKCHGESGAGNGPSSVGLKDTWEQPIRTADLTYKWQFKNGHRPEDIYRTFNAGLNGTPMPSFKDIFKSDDERWALVAYVLSLSPSERPVLHLKDFRTKFASSVDSNGIVRR